MSQRFSRYAWSVLGLNLLVILWGALVRASKSGEGCGDHWPLCNGTVVPHAAEIATLIEFTHRLTTGLALISVVVMAIWAARAFGPSPVRTAAIWSAVLIFTEALLGAGLVLFRYVGADQSVGRAVYLSAHLINTLLMLAAMALTAWWGSGHAPIRFAEDRSAARLLAIAIGAALIVGVSGAVAALSDTLFPATSLSTGWAADFSASAPLYVRLRIWHPVIAAVAGGYIAFAALMVSRMVAAARRCGVAVVALAGLQLTAGVVNWWLLAPIWMQLVHLMLADLLWLALVLLTAAALERSPVWRPQTDAPALADNPLPHRV
ncbi:MAG TPA: COX15/CtaA family protein [Bryobacteraceae bacterium]|nr:COX15/CtaA family protein [Bryobacteraceae bacterium]